MTNTIVSQYGEFSVTDPPHGHIARPLAGGQQLLVRRDRECLDRVPGLEVQHHLAFAVRQCPHPHAIADTIRADDPPAPHDPSAEPGSRRMICFDRSATWASPSQLSRDSQLNFRRSEFFDGWLEDRRRISRRRKSSYFSHVSARSARAPPGTRGRRWSRRSGN